MKKWINIDVSKLPFRKKKKIVEELLDIYTTEDYHTNKNEYRRVFTIPIGNLSVEDAKKQLNELMSKYSEVVELDKQIWYPVDENKKDNFFKRLFSKKNKN